MNQKEVADSIRDNLPKVRAVNDSTIQDALSAVFLAAGGLAVVFIAVGGLRYVISQGDPQRTQQAKETIIYAVVGLVVSLSAFGIVSFAYGIL